MKYVYLNGLPVYDESHSCYYQLKDFRICKFENGVEVENWQKIPNDFNRKVFEWSAGFWKT
jgi:hypothetical protein